MLVVLALLPVGMAWAYKTLHHPRPLWAFYYDPEMMYFVQGSNLLHGRVPSHVDHPGTPVQVLSAAIQAFTGDRPEDVDLFRRVAYALSLGLLLAGSAVLVLSTASEMTSIGQFSMIGALFLAPQVLEYRTVWSPECVMPFFGAATAALAWRFLTVPRPVAALFMGAALGACLAVKFTYLPWLPAALIAPLVDRRLTWGQKATAEASIAAGCATGFLLMTLPILARLEASVGFVLRVGTHTGPYGTGPSGQPALSDLLAKIWSMARSSKTWELLWLSALLSVALTLVRTHKPTRVVPLAAFAATGIVAAHVLAARGDGTLRYLVPVAPLAALLVGEAIGLLPSLYSRWAVAGVVFAALLRASLLDMEIHQRRIESQSALRTAIEDAVNQARQPGDTVIFGWRVPEPSFALRVMSQDRNYLAATEKLHPNEGHFTRWAGLQLPSGSRTWDLAVLSLAEVPSFPDVLARPRTVIGPYGLYVRRDRNHH